MLILFDECVPWPLRKKLPGHVVHSVPKLGWSGKKNGALIGLIQTSGFDVFITVDQNLPYQQNLNGAGVAIIVLIAVSNAIECLGPLVPDLILAIDRIRPEELIEVVLSENTEP